MPPPGVTPPEASTCHLPSSGAGEGHWDCLPRERDFSRYTRARLKQPGFGHRDNHDLERASCLSPFMHTHVACRAPSPGTPWDAASCTRLDSALQSALTLQPHSVTHQNGTLHQAERSLGPNGGKARGRGVPGRSWLFRLL